MFNQIAFGERLKNYRKAKNYTQGELALRVGVSAQAVSKWEKGECLPDVYNLKLLAKLYRVSMDFLMDIEDEGKISSGGKVMNIPLTTIKEFVVNELFTIPVLAEHQDSLSVYLTESRPAGVFSDKQNIDFEVVCPMAIFDEIQKKFFESGRTASLTASFYDFPEAGYKDYFGEITIPHFSLSPQERIKENLKRFDEEQMWMWINAKLIIDNGVSAVINGELLSFPQDVLIAKLKKYYMEYNLSIIDTYPAHDDADEMKHIAAYAIYNALINLYRFCFLAEKQPFPTADKLPLYAKSTKMYIALSNIFNEIYGLLDNLSGKDAWERLEKCRGMLCYDNLYASSRKISEHMDNALLEAGCEVEWVDVGYNNINAPYVPFSYTIPAKLDILQNKNEE